MLLLLLVLACFTFDGNAFIQYGLREHRARSLSHGGVIAQSLTSLNSVSSVLPTVESAAAVASVIAFHEAGHFSAARIQNITVDSFSIGFGPKVLSYNDSAGVEFCLRALPLGGYVSFPQNVVFDDDGNVVEELEAEDYPDLLAAIKSEL